MSHAGTLRRRGRSANDPERASRIAKAAWQILMSDGMGGLTHRAVARVANVPLGSTTYHFANIQALLAAAISDAIDEHVANIGRWAVDLNPSNVSAKLAGLLEEQAASPEARSRVLFEYELYLSAARAPELQELSQRWDSVLRGTLERCVGITAGRAFFAAYNGFSLENLIRPGPVDVVAIEGVLSAIHDNDGQS